MQKLFGLILLMSGLALTWLWLPASEGNRQLAEVVEIRDGVARLAVPNAPETAASAESEAPARRAASVPPLAISAPGPQQQAVGHRRAGFRQQRRSRRGRAAARLTAARER